MGLNECKSRRKKCGPLVSSICVSYEGDKTGVLKDLPCDAAVEDAIETLSTEVTDLKTKTAITGFKKKSLAISETASLLEILQAITDKELTHDTLISSITSDLIKLSAHNLPVTIDLKELSPGTGEKTYTLISIIKLLVAEIISLK